MTTPECPHCSEMGTLEADGPWVQEHKWMVCSSCSKKCLVTRGGKVVRTHPPVEEE